MSAPLAAEAKLLLRSALASVTHVTGAALGRLRGKVAILAYHRVLAEREVRERPVQPGMYVLDEVFDRQLAYLARNCDLLSFDELLRIWDGRGGSRGARYCVITFDDGWLDNYRNAFPILRSRGAPATIFLPTSLIGTDRWFWPERVGRLLQAAAAPGGATAAPQPSVPGDEPTVSEIAGLLRERSRRRPAERLDEVIAQLKRRPQDALERALDRLEIHFGVRSPGERLLLGWDEAREMSRHGVSFGSHGCSHRILTQLQPPEIGQELAASWRQLQDQRVAAVPALAYPNGDWSREIGGIAEQAGYRAAVTTRFGLETVPPADRFGLHRICIHNDIAATVPLFSARISGIFQTRRGGGARCP